MLPPAPKQTYIDVYIENKDSVDREDEKRKQADYEAEVKVYRALEMLQEEILVLHGFEYTHHQFRLFDHHDRRSCHKCKSASNREGECDFVILGINYFVIMEVKNVPHKKGAPVSEVKKGEFKGALRKSERQGEKIVCLIENIAKIVGLKDFLIVSFSAFPNTSSDINGDVQLQDNIVWEEDFNDFETWWQRKVLTHGNTADGQTRKCEEVKEILMTLWCTAGNLCDVTKCSLSKCIMDIDRELRNGRITFPSKYRVPNENVIKAGDVAIANLSDGTNIFRDVIGLEYLTVEQETAFSSKHNFLLLNGPAGSGKTVILLGKMIQLISRNQDNKVLLFVPATSENSDQVRYYQDILRMAKISNTVATVRPRNDDMIMKDFPKFYNHTSTLSRRLEALDFYNEDEFVQDILKCIVNHRIVIVLMKEYMHEAPQIMEKSKLISRDRNVHIFFDDWQAAPFWVQAEFTRYKLIEYAQEKMIWIACDLTQMNCTLGDDLSNTAAHSFLAEIPSQNIKTLSLSLRSTREIAAVLSQLRERLISEILDGRTEKFFLPKIHPGHVIHGPQINVYVLEEDKDHKIDGMSLKTILKSELNKLYNIIRLREKVGIITFGGTSIHTITTVIEELRHEYNMEFGVIFPEYCYSAEYPAVFVLALNNWRVNLQLLFLAMSRARVYCVIIMRGKQFRVCREQRTFAHSKPDTIVGLNEIFADLAAKIIEYK